MLFRVVAAIHYNTGIVFVLRVLTHKEYDTEKWKREL
jgi:mRNA-degrading endonuclease HigB of HigAB toxin-antitoxin module